MKILTSTAIKLNENRQEFPQNEKEWFDLLMANDGDILDFFSGYIPLHWHNELEFFVLLKGRVYVTVEKDCFIFILEPGEGCFINTNLLHSFKALVSSSCKYHSFVVSSEVISGYSGSVLDLKYIQPLLTSGLSFLKFSGEKDAFYFEQFSLAFSACLTQHYGYEFEIRQALSNILLFLLKKNLSSLNLKRTSSDLRQIRLKELLKWIDKNYLNPITAEMIAQKANVCTRECQRMFQQYLHCTPIEYLQKKRIYKAAQLLLTTSQSVTDIAITCGFSNPNYFTRQFKQFVGITPLKYRHTTTKTPLLTQELHPESSLH